METETDAIDVVEHELTRLLRRAESARTRHPAAHRLDRSAYLLLGELERRGPLGIGALAQSFQLDVSTASRQVSALEAKGLVERRADPADGRACLLELTPHGRSQLAETRRARRALFAGLLADWSDEDRRRFGAYLARLNQTIAEGSHSGDRTGDAATAGAQ